MRLGTGALAVVLLTVSCGGDTTYSSVEDLRDAAIDAGLECSSWEQDNKALNAAESGSCADRKYVFSTYATEADLQAAVSRSATWADLLETDEAAVIGENWIIKGPDVEDLAKDLGGTVQR